MNSLVAIYLFVLGLSFGSFSLAMVDRMKSKRDWVRGRSECEKCSKELRPRDLIPLVSWLYAGGKCRYCSVRLSRAYPATELGVGAVFVVSFVFWPHELTGLIPISMFVVWLVAVVIMSALFLFDIRWFLLPNKLVYPLIGLASIWTLLDILENGFTASGLLAVFFSVLVGSGLFLLLFVISNGKWIGDGDIRLGVAIGLFTGSWLGSWLVIFMASVLGLVVSLPMIIKSSKKKNAMKLKIPFGPLLLVALFLVVLFGQGIIDWYRADILLL